MQLDPEQPFSTQINNLIAQDFENVVSSAYFYMGYYIRRNISILVEKQQVAEIDVLASLLTPLEEILIAIECKGRTPNFKELRKFSAIKPLMNCKNYNVILKAYGANTLRQEHQTFSKMLGIDLYKKEDLSKLVLPILWGDNELRKNRITWFNRYLIIFYIQDYYLKQVFQTITDENIKQEISKYKKYLFFELWNIKDPVEQMTNAFEKAKTDFHDFSSKIANLLNLNILAELKNPTNEILQLAILLELYHRLFNVHSISRCSLLARNEQGRRVLLDTGFPRIRESLNLLCDYNMNISIFSNFLDRWIFLWGGFFLKGDLMKEEYSKLTSETSLSYVTINKFFILLRHIFGGGRDLFYIGAEKIFFKFIPAAFRALGLIHRRSLSSKYANVNLFRDTEDRSNMDILERALNEMGGVANLKFN